MDIRNTRGIVLKTMDLKESDKIVWIYTEEFGKISVIAKRSRSRNSKLMSLTQNFCFCNFNIYKGKSAFFLNEGQILDSFQDVLKDLDTLTYATYICELLDLTQGEKEKNYNLFKTAIKLMYLLKNRVGNYDTLMRYFEVRLIRYSGYNLDLSTCTRCGESIKVSDSFDLSNLGGVCDRCSKNNTLRISRGTYSTLMYIINNSIEKVYRLNMNSIIEKELMIITSHIINEISSRPPKSLEMLKILKGE